MVKGLVNGVQKEVMVTVATASSVTKNIKIGNKGKMSLLKHSSSSRHIDAVKNSIDPNQAKLFAKSSQLLKQSPQSTTSQGLGLIFHRDETLKAEILWLTKTACGNFSLRSTDKIGDLFREGGGMLLDIH